MKKLILLIFLCLIIPNKGFTKILELGSNTLDVPNKFYLYNWSNSSFNGQLNLCSDEFINCFGLIGKRLKEVMTRLDNGESFEDIKILKNLMSTLTKQTSNCVELDNGLCKSSMKRFWSKLKSTLKNNNSGTIFNYMEAKDADDFLDNLNFNKSIDEIREMTTEELNDLTTEIRNELSYGNKNYWAITDEFGIKVKKFKISKKSNGSVYSILQGDANYVLMGTQYKFKISFYASEKNGNLFQFDGMCLSDCSKFFNTFDKIVSNSFNKIETIEKISNSTKNNSLIKQLKELNNLFKAGVLTKEEFEKAKKKILN